MFRKGKKRSGLKMDELSASIENYRRKTEEKSYTPSVFFN